MMDYYRQHNTELYVPEEKPVERIPGIWPIVGLFIILTCTVSYRETWNYIVSGLGVILLISFMIRLLVARLSVMPELFMYGIWICWSLLALLNSPNSMLFWTKLMTVIQICIMTLIISGFTVSRKVLSLNLLAFLGAVCIVGGYSYLSGEYAAAESYGDRANSLMGSSGFGYLMLLGAVAIAYLWMLPTRWKVIKWIVLIGLMMVSMYGTFASGSRKSILGLFLFYACWVWFCYRKEVIRRPVIAVGIFLISVVLLFAAQSLMSKTASAGRLERTLALFEGTATKGAGEDRLDLYREGFRLLTKSPMFGLGLDNFTVNNSVGLMAHSDFMEVAVDTGIPGACLYFAVYVLLWRRSGKIAKLTRDPAQFKIARLIRATLLVTVLVSLGRSNYDSKETWLILSFFIGYSYQIHKTLQKEQSLAEFPAEPAMQMAGK